MPPALTAARGRRGTRGAAVLLASLLAHGAVLSIVGFQIPRLLTRNGVAARPPLALILVPEARPRAGAQAPAEIGARPAAESGRAERRGAASAPVSHDGGPVAAGETASARSGGAGAGSDARAALRSGIGCGFGSLLDLSPEEKARCAERTAVAAKAGPAFIDPIPPEKRAYYDAIQAAYQASRHPEAAAYVDADGTVHSWGRPPAIGCTFRQHFKPGASLSDKIKASGMLSVPLGPLSCGLALPQGSLTPELGIAPP